MGKHISLETGGRRFAIMLLVPTMLILFGLYAYPLCYSLYLSITNTNFFMPNVVTRIIWLKNYINLFQDEYFISSIIISFSFTGLVTVIELIIGMAMALLYSKDKFGLGVLRSIIVIPMMITPVCAGLIWKYMFHPAFGLVNYLLGLVGIQRIGWHTEMNTAFLTVILVDVWMLTPFVIIIAISGLSALPKVLYEAASIDGANKWQQFVQITLPLMKPIIVIIELIRLIDAFKVFDNVWIMTRGGPVRKTELFTIYAYKDAMLRGNLGSGALARFHFKGRNFIGLMVLVLTMIPVVTLLIPFYDVMRLLGLIGSHAAIILVYIAFNLPFCVWLMRGYFLEIPKEVEEAAHIDGCSRMGVLLRIVLPLSKPGMVSATIFTLMMSWSDFVFAGILGSKSSQTLPVIAAATQGKYSSEWGQLAAITIIITVPIVVFTLFTQQYLVKGLTHGAVKG